MREGVRDSDHRQCHSKAKKVDVLKSNWCLQTKRVSPIPVKFQIKRRRDNKETAREGQASAHAANCESSNNNKPFFNAGTAEKESFQ